MRHLVLKAAQSKLRLKKASRFFVAGTGAELLSEEDWRRAIRNDIVLLVSAGEEWVGGSEKRSANVHGSFCPYFYWGGAWWTDNTSL